MKIKVSELEGNALDWAVAKCGYKDHALEKNNGGSLSFDAGLHPYMADLNNDNRWQVYKPSGNWAQGGPIIEREEIGISLNLPCSDGRRWRAVPSVTAKGAGGKFGYGHTPLIAAMRCYVATKRGDEIEVPDQFI